MSRAHWVATLSRVFCGVVFIVHGYPKIMNLAGTSTFFAENFGVPGWVAIPIAILEFFGGILLVAGFATRILSPLFILEMLGAIVFVHFARGWDIFQGGYEYNLALIILLLAVFLLGSGPVSIDERVSHARGTDRALGERGSVAT
jgi:putative oxidoreductase